MILAESLTLIDGRVLVARGHEITPALLATLMNYRERQNIKIPIRVIQKTESTVSMPC